MRDDFSTNVEAAAALARADVYCDRPNPSEYEDPQDYRGPLDEIADTLIERHEHAFGYVRDDQLGLVRGEVVRLLEALDVQVESLVLAGRRP